MKGPPLTGRGDDRKLREDIWTEMSVQAFNIVSDGMSRIHRRLAERQNEEILILVKGLTTETNQIGRDSPAATQHLHPHPHLHHLAQPSLVSSTGPQKQTSHEPTQLQTIPSTPNSQHHNRITPERTKRCLIFSFKRGAGHLSRGPGATREPPRICRDPTR